MRHPSRLLAALLALACAAAPAQPDTAPVQAHAVYTPRTDGSGLADLTLELRAAASGQPLDYPARRLAAWLHKPVAGLVEAAGEPACADTVRTLASPGVGRRAAVDFNTYRLLAVNSDRTLTFINPFLRLNQAKLEDVLTLPGAVQALLHRPAEQELWLALPEADQVVVVDTGTRRVRHTHQLAAGARPAALAEAGGAVWVAQDGRDGWLRIAHAQAQPDTMPAPRVQAFAAVPGERAPLGLSGQGVVVQDGGGARVEATGPVAASAWSALSQRLLLALRDGGLAWMDRQGRTTQRLASAPVQQLALFDDGRYALAVAGPQLLVVDVASAAVQQTLALAAPVSDIAFTGGFAYLHSPGAAHATLLALADLRQGRAQPVQVAMGAPAGATVAGLPPGLGAQRLQPVPDGTGMFVASPHDGQIYQYAEGMMAPIGSFSNYRRSAMALLLLDDGLQPLGAGRYRATLRAPREGRYELVLSGVQPRFAECRTLQLPAVAGAERHTSAPPALQARLLAAQPTAEGLRVRAQLQQGADGPPLAGVRDLVLVAFDRRNGWQARQPMRADGAGGYEALIASAPAGELQLHVSSISHDLPPHAGLLGRVRAGSAP